MALYHKIDEALMDMKESGEPAALGGAACRVLSRHTSSLLHVAGKGRRPPDAACHRAVSSLACPSLPAPRRALPIRPPPPQTSD
jgi:hypothetical protein